MSGVAKGIGVDPACPYQDRMNARPEFYEFLQHRFDVWRTSPPPEKAPPVEKHPK